MILGQPVVLTSDVRGTVYHVMGRQFGLVPRSIIWCAVATPLHRARNSVIDHLFTDLAIRHLRAG